jgi:hypothetical protein
MSIRSEFKKNEKSRGMMSSEKIRRLVNLSRWADITVGMDDMENAEDISRAAEAVRTTINVVIEITFGRYGVDAGEPALALAKRIVELKGLKFKGLFAHQGSYAKFEERKRMIRAGPQVKGKIEKPYKWIQDRLVRTCYRERIPDIKQAQLVLNSFIQKCNHKIVYSNTGGIPYFKEH